MILQKSYKDKKESGTLYIVPTPIGNIKDITLRAIEILKDVDIIYAEDTRTSSILLNSLHIKKTLRSCHLHNEKTVKYKMVEELKEGKNLALISDQGTPLLSDPGYEAVKEIINNNINVVALPGPSALLPALNMSGIEANKFLFYGFLNSKVSASRKELEELKETEYTIVLYESPHRLQKTLTNILQILGNRNISISREISKIYEEVYRGLVDEAIDFYIEPKGEFVIVIEKGLKIIDVNNILKEVQLEIDKGSTNKDAVKLISKKYGVSKNLLYNKFEEGKKWN